MSALRPDQVDPTLAKLWAAKGDAARAARVRTVNLVAVCSSSADATRAEHVARDLLHSHPGRAIVVCLAGGAAHGMTATAHLVDDPNQPSRACGELVRLTVSGSAREFVPEQVDRLLAPGARVCLWWVGDLPDRDALYDRLTEIADLVTVDSGEMDLRDVQTLWRLVESARARFALADLNWTRLRPWQEMLARFFDDPAVLPQLERSRTLAIDVAGVRPGEIEEPTSPQAALFAGWFAARIGVRGTSARWVRDGESWRVTLDRVRGGSLELRFDVRAPVPGLHAGALVRASLETESCASFELSRSAEDPRVLGWQGTCIDAVIPPAVLRVHEPSETRLLARLLDSPMRNTLFESSLRTASELSAPARAGH